MIGDITTIRNEKISIQQSQDYKEKELKNKVLISKEKSIEFDNIN